MLRGVVTLLVVLPLLMPPGMCICQFVHKGRPAAVPNGLVGQDTAATADPDEPAECCFRCARSKSRSSGQTEPRGQPAPEQGRSSTPTSPDDPCCPVVKTGAWS